MAAVASVMPMDKHELLPGRVLHACFVLKMSIKENKNWIEHGQRLPSSACSTITKQIPAHVCDPVTRIPTEHTTLIIQLYCAHHYDSTCYRKGGPRMIQTMSERGAHL